MRHVPRVSVQLPNPKSELNDPCRGGNAAGDDETLSDDFAAGTLSTARATTSVVPGLKISENFRPNSAKLICGERGIDPAAGVFSGGGGTAKSPVDGLAAEAGLKSSENVLPASCLGGVDMASGGGLASGRLSPGAGALPRDTATGNVEGIGSPGPTMRDAGTGDVEGVGRGLSP
jgi:hypothetical protein